MTVLLQLNQLLGSGVVLDPNAEYPCPDYTMETDAGVTFAPRRNLMAINGKSKAGKTHFIVMLIASWLGYKGFGLRTRLSEGETIVYADTDQDRSYQMRVFLRVARLLGRPAADLQERLVFLNLREKTAKERLEIVTKTVESLKPAVFVLDNIAHLVGDYNDPKESFRVMDRMKALASKYLTLIALVIHQNKDAADKNMKGHLGTNIVQDATDVFAIEYKDGERRVRHQYSRDMPIPDFSFRIVNDPVDGLALPELCRSNAEQLRENEKAEADMKRRDVFYRIFEGHPLPLAYCDLVRAYVQETSLGEATAKRHLKSTIDEGVVLKNDDNLYVLNSQPF